MNPPVMSDDYSYGQMMGMLVIIQLLEDARDSKVPLSMGTLEKIKRISVEYLSEYLQKPEEDVILLIANELRNT